MRIQLLLLLLLTAGSAVHGSWFSGNAPTDEPAEYANWSAKDLKDWLDAHNVPYSSQSPTTAELQAAVKAHWDSVSSWPSDTYNKAQSAFSNLKSDAFDAWDESHLREFLLEQGVVNPSGSREQLALLAKQKWRQYSAAANAYTQSAYSGASSFSSSASQHASSAIYGDSFYQASKSVNSLIAQATDTVARTLDDSKDYVYSTWDDNQIRSWLEEHGVIDHPPTTRDKLLSKMKETYSSTSSPVWQSWSDSYISQWLVDHGIKDDYAKRRDDLVKVMQDYYYGASDKVWDSWNDSQMKEWLVQHKLIKSSAQVNREKMQKLVADNYDSVYDTTWSAWKDSDMRQWLVERGYIRSDAQKSRDEMIKLMRDKYNDTYYRFPAYVTWPDARLRAYLRESGVPAVNIVSKTREELLQEVRARWRQAGWQATSLWRKVKSYFDSGVEVAEDKLGMILEILTGGAEGAKEGAKTGAYQSAEKHHQTTKIEL